MSIETGPGSNGSRHWNNESTRRGSYLVHESSDPINYRDFVAFVSVGDDTFITRVNNEADAEGISYSHYTGKPGDCRPVTIVSMYKGNTSASALNKDFVCDMTIDPVTGNLNVTNFNPTTGVATPSVIDLKDLRLEVVGLAGSIITLEVHDEDGNVVETFPVDLSALNSVVTDLNSNPNTQVIAEHVAAGITTQIKETITSLSIDAGYVMSFTDETGTSTPIDLSGLKIDSTSYDCTTGELTLTFLDASTEVINLAALKSILTPVVTTGQTIATHDDGCGNVVDIKETVSTMSKNPATGLMEYTDETGTVTTFKDADDLTCEGDCIYEPVEGASGTLADGVTSYTVDAPTSNESFNGQGDITWGSNSGAHDLNFTFSSPVDIKITSAITNGTQAVWHIGANAANGTTAATTNGSAWVFTPGTFPLNLDLNGQTVTSLTPTGSAPRANDDWGTLISTGVTSFTINSSQNEKFNFEFKAAGVCEIPVCEAIDNLLDITSDNSAQIAALAAIPADSDFVGATSANDGASGNVPQPNAGEEGYFLAGDGTWQEICLEKTVYSYTVATPGILEENWVANGATNDLPSNIFIGSPGGAFGLPDHVNGAPELSQVVASMSENFPDANGDTDHQARFTGWVYIPKDGTQVDEVNANTGEYLRAWVGDTCNAPQVIAERNTLTTGGDTGLGLVGTFDKGWHFFSIEVSDVTAFGGVQLRMDNGGDGNFSTIPAANYSVDEPVLSCRQEKVDYILLDNELECAPTCGMPKAIIAEEPIPTGVSSDAGNSLTLGADGLPFYDDQDTVFGISTDPNNSLMLGTDGLFFFQDSDLDMVGADAANDGASGNVPQPLAGQQDFYLAGDGTFKEILHDKTVYSYTVANPGVLKEEWVANGASTGVLSGIFNGSPVGDYCLPGHVNGAPEISGVANDFNESFPAANGDVDHQMRVSGWVYIESDGTVLSESNAAIGEYYRVWKGDSCNAPSVILETTTPTDGASPNLGVIGTFDKGWHFFVFEVSDFTGFGGINIREDVNGDGNFTAINASRFSVDEPVLECRTEKEDYVLLPEEFECAPTCGMPKVGFGGGASALLSADTYNTAILGSDGGIFSMPVTSRECYVEVDLTLQADNTTLGNAGAVATNSFNAVAPNFQHIVSTAGDIYGLIARFFNTGAADDVITFNISLNGASATSATATIPSGSPNTTYDFPLLSPISVVPGDVLTFDIQAAGGASSYFLVNDASNAYTWLDGTPQNPNLGLNYGIEGDKYEVTSYSDGNVVKTFGSLVGDEFDIVDYTTTGIPSNLVPCDDGADVETFPFRESSKIISDNVNNIGINDTTTAFAHNTLSVAIPENGLYEVKWHYVWSLNSEVNDFVAQIYIDNGAGTVPLDSVSPMHSQEPKDVGGVSPVLLTTALTSLNTGTNQRHQAYGYDELTLNAGTFDMALAFESEVAGDRATIYRSILTITRIG